MSIKLLNMSFSNRNKIEEINVEKYKKKMTVPISLSAKILKDNFSKQEKPQQITKSITPQENNMKSSRSLSSMLMNLQNAKKCGSCGGFKH